MRTAWFLSTVLMLVLSPAGASPQQDLEAFRSYFLERFPGVPLADYADGAFGISEEARARSEQIRELAPIEGLLDRGRTAFEKPFADGATYASCFKNGGIGIRQFYPYYDTHSGLVKTLEYELNECRVRHGQAPLAAESGELAEISAYLASTSQGEPMVINLPDDPGALAAYERGKKHFYTKRGQLNMSCADCHQSYAGNKIRADVLSPALGHVSHFPAYRTKWSELGTLHRHYMNCNQLVRAEPFAAQSAEYRALEYFQSFMSNGVPINAPGARR